MKRYEASEWTILARPVITAHDRHEWALRVREGHDHDDIPVGHDAVEVVPAATLRGVVEVAREAHEALRVALAAKDQSPRLYRGAMRAAMEKLDHVRVQ